MMERLMARSAPGVHPDFILIFLGEDDANRTMIAPGHLRPDESFLQSRPQSGRNAAIVDPPSYVPGARIVLVTPPGVVASSGLKFPKGIEESSGQKTPEVGPFLRREACIAEIALRAGQINFRVGDIEIATENDRLLFFQVPKEFEKIRPPGFHPVGEAAEFPLRVGHIDIDHEKVLILGGEDPPLLIMFLPADSILDAERFRPGEDRRPGIAGARGGIPKHRITRKLRVDLFGPGFDFLHADNIRVRFEKKILKALAEDGADAIDVPRDDFHEY